MRALNPVTPPELEQVIQACLAKDPNNRWQNAFDLKLQLQTTRDSAGRQVPAPRASRNKLAGWAVAAVVLLGAWGLWLFRPAGARQSVQAYRASLLPPSGTRFAPYNFAVSPDGKRLAFVAIAPDGGNTLWVRAFDGRDAQQITGTDDAAYPFWAPDSRRIGFFAGGQLKIADIGGAIQVLCDAPLGRGGAWSRQGVILFAPSVGGPLSRISEHGGKPEQATRLDPQSGKAHRWPWFLPDEKHFLFFQDYGGGSDPSPNGIYAGSLDGGEPKLISADLSGSVALAAGHLLYVQESSLMAQPFDPDRLALSGSAVPVFDREVQQDHAYSQSNFSVSASGAIVFQSLADAASELIWYSADGKEAGRVPESGGLTPSLSPDGRFLAISSDETHNGQRYIRVHDLQRGVATRLTDGGREEFPVWSPDGKTIAYGAGSTQGRSRQIYEIAADGSGKPELLLQGPRMAPTDYSPDGRYLAYMAFGSSVPDVGVYDRRERKSVVWGRGGEPQFSPDGKWLTYTAGGVAFMQSFSPSGARQRISSGGGGQPRWSQDGRRLFFFAPDRKFMEVPIEMLGGELRPGVPHPLFQTHVIAPRFANFQYDVTRDGTRFIVNSLKPGAPLTLVTSWPAALRR